MSIRRVVPNLRSSHLEESREFYAGFIGLNVAMDMGWIITLVSPTNPTAQLSLITSDRTAPVHPDISIEVDNLGELHTEAIRRGLAMRYPLTNEPWGVRRFFVVDPNGRVVNLMTHANGPG